MQQKYLGTLKPRTMYLFKWSENTIQKVCQLSTLWLNQLLGGSIKNPLAFNQSVKRGLIGMLGLTETERQMHSIFSTAS